MICLIGARVPIGFSMMVTSARFTLSGICPSVTLR